MAKIPLKWQNYLQNDRILSKMAEYSVYKNFPCKNRHFEGQICDVHGKRVDLETNTIGHSCGRVTHWEHFQKKWPKTLLFHIS